MNFDLGPLPTDDDESVLEERSRNALQSALPSEKLIFRAEPVRDRGVDGSIEARLLEGAATNFRAQVQVKARSGTQPSSDGSIALSVSTTNLNYLLNGDDSIYILYRAESDEIRFAWARDERQRIEAKNPHWKDQSTVTLYFREILSEDTAEAIHARILREGNLRRQTRDVLSLQAQARHVTLVVDPQAATVEDPARLFELLLSSGITHALHDPQGVLNRSRALSQEQLENPHVSLVLGFALFLLGHYLEADARIATAVLYENNLEDEDDRCLLHFLRDACEYETGRIDRQNYIERQERWINVAPPYIRHQLTLLSIQKRVQAAPESESAVQLLREGREVLQEIDALPGGELIKLHSRLVVLETEGYRVALQCSRNIRFANVGGIEGRLFRGGLDPRDLLQEASESWAKWESEIAELLTRADQADNLIFVCQGLLTRSLVRIGLLSGVVLAGADDSLEVEALSQEISQDLEDVEHLASDLGLRECLLRGRLFQAQLLELRGLTSEAETLANSVLRQAEAQRYKRLTASALDQAEGQFRQLRQKIARQQSREEKDDEAVGWSEEDIARTAQRIIQHLELPAERFEIIREEFRQVRQLASERISWCRHLAMEEHRLHAQNRATFYARHPPRGCKCSLLGQRTQIESEDWRTVLESFKRAYCVDCSSRSPRETG